MATWLIVLLTIAGIVTAAGLGACLVWVLVARAILSAFMR